MRRNRRILGRRRPRVRHCADPCPFDDGDVPNWMIGNIPIPFNRANKRG